MLTAAQINRLAQRLSDKPLGRSASATTAAERLQRLLAVRIGGERAAASAKAIFDAPGFETAEGRLVAEIECDEDEVDVGTLAVLSSVAPAPAHVPAIAAVVVTSLKPAAPAV
jgi:hypothetical protein